jgi:hypothetical protein
MFPLFQDRPLSTSLTVKFQLSMINLYICMFYMYVKVQTSLTAPPLPLFFSNVKTLTLSTPYRSEYICPV